MSGPVRVSRVMTHCRWAWPRFRVQGVANALVRFLVGVVLSLWLIREFAWKWRMAAVALSRHRAPCIPNRLPQ